MAENINTPAMYEVLSRDPDFIKLDPSTQTKMMDTFFFDKNLLLKTLNERDPEFRQLDPNLQKQIADKIIEDYSYYYTKKKTEEEALERPFIDIPDAAAIAATGGGYAAWKLGTKAGTKVGLELLGQVGKKAVTSGITGLITEYPVGMAIEETTKRITKSKLPDTVKMALNLTIPLAIGGASARFLDSRLERAIENSADKLAFNKLKKTMRKTLEDLGDITDATLQAENINDVISKTQELQNTIDSILKSKSVSNKFKQGILALPDYAWRFVPEEWRRDLPVPSRAMPMGENVPEVNKVAREMLETKYPVLPESPITRGEVLPEKTIISTEAGEAGIPKEKAEKEAEEVFTRIEPEETGVKEPWQMTAEEYADSVGATTPIDRSLARQEWEDKVWEAYKEGKIFLNTVDDEVIRTIEKKEQEESFYDYEPESEYTQEYQLPEKEDYSHAYYQEGLEEIKKDMLDRYERVSKVLRDYGINSQDLNSHAGKTGLQMIRSKYGFSAVKKDGLPLDVIGQRIQEVAPELLPENPDANDVYKLLEDLPAKRDIQNFNYNIKLYSGINFLEGLKQLDQLGSNAIKKTVELIDRNPHLKKARLWLKSFYEPLPHLTEESRENFLNAYYGTLRPKEAIGGLQAKELSGTIKKILKDYSENEQTAIEVIIRYLEDPAFRKVAKNLDDFKEITSQLDEIAKAIDDYSEQLYQRGIITKSQREKWKGRYLTRLYMEDQALKGGVSSLSGITEQKIYKGRKIESIMDLAKKDREALGYIEDPVLSVKMNIAKNAHTLAADEFYRELINDPNFVLKDYVMDNPFAKLFPHQLPEKASPKYMLERVLPWVEDEVKGTDNPEVLKLIEDTKERAKQLQDVLNDKRFEKTLPEDFMILRGEGTKYGVLTGLPVHKDVGLQVIGLWEMGNIPETALTKIDKVANAIYTWFKIAKVPFNLRAYPRNYVTNIFQFALENKGNPIPYLQEQAKTIKGIIEKDKYFQEALRNGLLDQNFAKKEIIDVLQSLKGTKSQKVAEILSKLSLPYGWIDDFAKLNTYRIMRKRGMSPLQAVRRAQEIHYDYGLVPFWVRQIRQPSLTKGGIVGKLIMSPFVTFQSKAVGQLVRTFSQNPATVSALLSSLFIAKYKIEKYYEQKYGKKYKEGEILSPTYLRNPLVVHIMTKDGKHRYIDISQILPVGWLINAIGEAGGGDVLSAASEFGLGSSPLNVAGEVISGKDFFTGREMYSSLDSGWDKIVKGGEHAAKKLLLPATVDQIQTWKRSRHPVFARWITGTNIYDYTPAQLQAMVQYNLRGINSDFKREAASLKNKYARGIISEKDYIEGMKKLLKKRKAAITKILNYKNLKEQ